MDIRVFHISSKNHPAGRVERGQALEESAAIAELVREGRFDHVALLGYMKIVRGPLAEEYGWWPSYDSVYQTRMSNTHPGPLPETADTYGIHAAERVLELGLTASRHTLALVGAEIDAGPILAEHSVEVLTEDTPAALFARTQVVEKVALPYALDRFLQEQLTYREQLRGDS